MTIEIEDTYWVNKSEYDKAEKYYYEEKYKEIIEPEDIPDIIGATEQKEMLYLNPLTVEAHFFLESLQEANEQEGYLDPELAKLLESIVDGIERFLDKKPKYIVSTKDLHCVQQSEIANIKRTFSCATCDRIVGNKIKSTVSHLLGRQHEAGKQPTQPTQQPQITGKKKQNKTVPRARGKNSNIQIQIPKKVKALISNEMTDVFKMTYQIADKLKTLPEYNAIETDLLATIAPLFPNQPVRIYKFGSRISGIGSRSSDLDIFVDIGNTFNNFQHHPTRKTIQNLAVVRKGLEVSKGWRILRVIDQARVPIIRSCHVATGIDCDIGFSNSLGFCNTNLMKYIFESQPIAQYMCIYLKKWLERTKLDNMSTYAVTLMIVYFLQLKRLLPSIERLQADTSSQQLIGPWVGNFSQKTLKEVGFELVDVSVERLSELLKGFFEYYGTFDYAKNMICPYFGIDSVKIANIEKALPTRYTKYAQQNPDCILQLNKPMVVQDPIQLNHNVTKAVTIPGKHQFVSFCQQTVVLMNEIGNF